ncbi:MAG: TRAP transporter small permease [Actinobacteria bacterium]|nr:TRAP transporter small permease [Actinomycetota bacterium]
MKYYEKIESIMDKIVITWIVLMLLIMVIVICVKVILYKLFSIPMNWYLEVAQYCLINIAYFGASLAFRLKQHVSIDIIVAKLSNKTKELIETIDKVLLIPFLFILFYASLIILFKSRGITPVLELPLYIYYFPVCGGSFFLCTYALLDLLKRLYLHLR